MDDTLVGTVVAVQGVAGASRLVVQRGPMLTKRSISHSRSRFVCGSSPTGSGWSSIRRQGCWSSTAEPSVPTTWFAALVPERGARMARRDEGANWAFVTEEQRRQAGCPARE